MRLKTISTVPLKGDRSITENLTVWSVGIALVKEKFPLLPNVHESCLQDGGTHGDSIGSAGQIHHSFRMEHGKWGDG